MLGVTNKEIKNNVSFYYFILNNLKGTTSARVTVTILKEFTDA